jgi:hypothetical protein
MVNQKSYVVASAKCGSGSPRAELRGSYRLV